MEVFLIVLALILPPATIWFGFWLSCRLFARRCPECGSKWRTELHGEWGGELCKCHRCGHCWEEN